ncbi:MAG: molybdate ABC transporter permease subunit, partial [Mycolicibacterium sp.]
MTVRRTGGTIQVGLPVWVYLPAALGALFVITPLLAVLLRIDWPNFLPLITSESSRTALLL